MLIIAHRGYSGKAPENTMTAFSLALLSGAKALELDVHQTKDGRLAVLHDDNLKRVAGLNQKIARMTWSEVQKAEVGAWFDARFAGERIPEFKDVLDLAQGRAEVHVELKAGSGQYPGIEENVCRELNARKAWKKTMVSSFDHAALYAVRKLAAGARLGYLLGDTPLPLAWRQTRELGAESLNVSVRQASALLARQSRQRGLKLFVYTVNDSKTLARMTRLGVDGIYTNFPEMKSA